MSAPLWHPHTINPTPCSSALIAVQADDGNFYMHPNGIAIWRGEWLWEFDEAVLGEAEFWWCNEGQLLRLINTETIEGVKP